MRIKCLIFCLLFQGLVSVISAQDVLPVDVSTIQGQCELTTYIRELNVPKGAAVDEILSAKYNSSSVAYNPKKVIEANVDAWLMFKVGKAQSPIEWMVGTSYYDTITYYTPRADGTYKMTKGGIRWLNAEREVVDGPASYARFVIPQDTTIAVYIHIQNSPEPFFDYAPTELTLISSNEFNQEHAGKLSFLYFVVGAILIMGFYNFFIYLIVRDHAYLYYLGYNLSFCAFILITDGGIIQHLFADSSQHFTQLNHVGSFTVMFYILFTKKLLELKKWHPTINKILTWLFIVYCISEVCNFLHINTVVLIGNFILSMVVLNVIAVSAFLVYFKKKYLPARYFLLALLFYFTGAIMMILQMLHILPAQIMGMGASEFLKTGETIQLTLFSLSLASRYAVMRQKLAEEELEKEKIQRQKEMEMKEFLEKENELLEAKVEERTHELMLEKDRVVQQNKETELEKAKSDKLLLNILPHDIAEELKQNGSAAARQFNNVTVLFTDFVNFTGISQSLTPGELVSEIHKNFTAIDEIMEKHGLEKIKTIGDAYLAVAGLPNEVPDHAQRSVHAALDIVKYFLNTENKFQIRIGIHSGTVVAGIVGVKKYAYDIWGDTVNTASRMEENSEGGKINVSGATYALISNDFTFTYRGKINAKNKGEVDMYFVEYSHDAL